MELHVDQGRRAFTAGEWVEDGEGVIAAPPQGDRHLTFSAEGAYEDLEAGLEFGRDAWHREESSRCQPEARLPRTSIARDVADPRFVDVERGDYRLRPESPTFELGFRPIPVDRPVPNPSGAAPCPMSK